MQTERTPPGATFTGVPLVGLSAALHRRNARDLTPSRLAILKRLHAAGGTVTVNGRSWPAVRFLTDVGFTAYSARSLEDVGRSEQARIIWRLTDAGRAALKYRDAR